MNYKVMLVDDEEEARSAIARRVNWQEIGFELVAEAENGEDALEKYEMYSPDVVMTDIHMPFMDGLELCKRLKSISPSIRIVIFSGYDEFEYAKEAISLEVEEYILKPVDADDVSNVFSRIKVRLDEEFDRRLNIEKLEKYYQESIPILKEQFLIGLLEGRVTQDMLDKNKDMYNLPLDSSFYAISIVEPDYSKSADSNNLLDSNLFSVSLRQMVDESLDGAFLCYSINYLGTIVVIAELKKTQDINQFVSKMDQICKLSKKMFNTDTIAGVGKVYGKLIDVAYSYEEAKEAAMYRIMLDTNQAIYIGDVAPKTETVSFMDERQTEQIIREIKVGSRDTLTEAVNSLIKRMKNTTITLSQLQLFFAEVVLEITRLARAYQIESEEVQLYDLDIYNEIRSFSSLESIGEWLLSLCTQLMDSIHKERVDSTKLLAEKAKEYVAKNYADSTLSVDQLCGYLGVSATYFSSVFKRETGMNFVAYLTKIRMDEALNLLQTTEEKSYVIAGKIGYDEPNYFSYVFKKQFGVSPSKYRQNNS